MIIIVAKVKQFKENVCVLSKDNKNGQGGRSPTMGPKNPRTPKDRSFNGIHVCVSYRKTCLAAIDPGPAGLEAELSVLYLAQTVFSSY